MSALRLIISLATASVLLILSYNVVMVAVGLVRSSAIIKASSRFTRVQEDARFKVLVLGDSTAVGTGASSPDDSVAGRIAADFSDVAIFNYARDGALTAELQQQLALASDGPYNMTLLQVGGNDALRFTAQKSLKEAIEAILVSATNISERVILVGTGDLGEAPSIPWPLSSLYSYRSTVVRDTLLNAAKLHGAEFIDLIAIANEEGSFRENPDKYYARDGLHPSSAGYKLWYLNLRESVDLDEWFKDAE